MLYRKSRNKSLLSSSFLTAMPGCFNMLSFPSLLKIREGFFSDTSGSQGLIQSLLLLVPKISVIFHWCWIQLGMLPYSEGFGSLDRIPGLRLCLRTASKRRCSNVPSRLILAGSGMGRTESCSVQRVLRKGAEKREPQILSRKTRL